MKKSAIGYIVLLFMLLIFHAEMSGQNNTLASYVLNKDISNKTEASSYLSSKIVTAIAQDENGMMWFGTKRGLNSFDSYNFEEYNQLDGIINATIKLSHIHKVAKQHLFGHCNLVLFNEYFATIA